MKHLLCLALWSTLVFVVSFFGHWTLGTVCAFAIIPIFRPTTIESGILGFFSGLIAWGGLAYYLDQANSHQLSQMIGNLLTIPSSVLLVIMTATIGGIGIALSGWLASAFLSANN